MEASASPTGNGYYRNQPDSFKVSDILRILRRQRGWMLAAAVPVVVLTGLFTILSAPVYRAETTLRVEEQQRPVVPVLDVLAELARGATVETEMEILRSRSVAEGVVRDLALQARVERPKRTRREDLFADIAVAADARRSDYRVLRERNGYRVEGPEGQVDAAYGEATELGPLTVSMRRPAVGAESEGVYLRLAPFAQTVIAFQEALSVSRPQREAALVSVTYESTDPALARDVVNAVSRHFLALRNTMQKQRASSTVVFLQGQVASMEEQLAAAEADLERFRQENLLVQAEAQVTEDVRRLADLQAERNALEIERSSLRELLKGMEGPEELRPSWAELASFPTFLKNQAIANILEQLTQLETERARLLARRTLEDPDIVNLEATTGLLQARLDELARSYLHALDEQAMGLDAMLAKFDAQLQKIPAIEVEYARLKRNTDVLGELYTLLQTRLKEAEISEAVEAANIQVVDPGVLPARPIKPRPLRNILLGLFLGAALAVGVALLRENLDTRVRTRDELLELVGLPVLAAVPQIPATNGRKADRAVRVESRLVTQHSPNSPAAEAYRALRTNLTFSAAGRGRPIKKLLFTSPEPQDGKSTTAANTAIAMAEQGHRTLLVECDLRRAILNRVFGVERSPGLVEVLVGQAGLDEAARSIPMPEYVAGSLDLVPAGIGAPNPAELLGSAAMEAFLDRAASIYDMVVFDTPPLNVVTDAAVVGTFADAVVLVTRRGMTHREAVRLAVQELRAVNAPVVGIVLNDLTVADRAYYKRYYGGYTKHES